jgi:hypothetical protein
LIAAAIAAPSRTFTIVLSHCNRIFSNRAGAYFAVLDRVGKARSDNPSLSPQS